MIPGLNNLPLKRERNQTNEMSFGRIRSILDAQMYLKFDKLICHLQFSPCQLLLSRNQWFLVCTICYWSTNETKQWDIVRKDWKHSRRWGWMAMCCGWWCVLFSIQNNLWNMAWDLKYWYLRRCSVPPEVQVWTGLVEINTQKYWEFPSRCPLDGQQSPPDVSTKNIYTWGFFIHLQPRPLRVY